jgi:tetratricopeptide (TPR) repeat protein/tRNA A-37 threonylcarbamoyl transferase component Bud32
MTEATRSADRALSLPLARRVNAVCNRFERAWRSGPRPAIEDYLGDIAEPARAALLRELIALEVAYRQQAGEAPQAEEYEARFPAGSLPAASLFGHDAPTRPAPSPEAAATPPAVPGYEILEVLGRGGMGIVYKARHHRLQRLVALKMILAGAHAGPRELARFRTEAEAVARLQHPNIVQIYEVGEQHGLPYCALEFVDGGSLARKLAGTPLPPRQAARLAATLAEAMHAGHQRGVVHRDLKPDNVLLTADGTPKVTDFGLAKKLDADADQTASGAIVGTPSYMAPEQARGRGKEVGPAADVYALGALLYEALTGRAPFKAATLLETMLQAIHEEPVPPRRFQPAVPMELETICLKCLAKDPAHRYASALALAEDLKRFLGGEPIQARPSSRWEQAVKWAQRKPAAAGLVGVSALAVLTLFGVVLGFTLKLSAALKATQEQRDLAERREKDADRQRAAAEQERAVAQAVNDFLQFDLLRQANSYEQANRRFTPDPDVKVRTLLDRAAAGIDERFRGQPLVAAAIHQAVGDAYQGVGKYVSAIRHLTAARELRMAHLGPDHGYTLSTLHSLASAYRDAGRTAEAIRLLEQERGQRTQKLGPDHPDTVATLHSLAVAYGDAGRLGEAIHMLEQVRAQRTQKCGPDHPETLLARKNLAVARVYAGRTAETAETIRTLEEVRARQTEKLGADHPETVHTSYALGWAYWKAGRNADAIELLEQVRGRQTEKLGPDHPDTLATLHSLGRAYQAADRTADAIQLLEDVHGRRVQKLGPDHHFTLATGYWLALAYQSAGRTTDAIQLFEQVREQQRTKLGPNHPDTLATLFDLALSLETAGQVDRAVAIARELLEARSGTLSTDQTARAGSLALLGICLLKAGKPTEAEPLLRECLTIRQQTQPDDWTTFNAQSLLGGALAGQQKYAEAESLLLAGFEGMAARAKTIPPRGQPRLREAQERVVQLYDAWGKNDRAAAWRKKQDLATAAQATR